MAAQGERDPRAPRSPNASAARSRSASTTSTRSRAATSRSSATRPRRTCARRSACPYTQHETLLRDGHHARARRSSSACATTPTSSVPGARPSAREHGRRAFDPERYLQSHPAEQHRLYLIPAGTPHASGAGNVVLEISATPYLYTLRFYDWLRRDLDGELRPVHVEHAFANLDPRPARATPCARPDAGAARRARRATAGRSSRSATLPELFFAVHRLDFDGRGRRTTRRALPRAQPRRRARRSRSRPTAGDVHRLVLRRDDRRPGRGRPRTGSAACAGRPCKVVKAFVP